MLMKNSRNKMNTSSANLQNLIQGSAIAFLDADANDDKKLTYDEFMTIVPEELRKANSEETLRETFQMADANSDGSISLEEYFFWTLGWASKNSGAANALEQCFHQYDDTGDGQLNLREFTRAVSRFGYGDLGHSIFRELDNDNTGTVSYPEIIEALKARRGVYSVECRQLLTAMSFQMQTASQAREAARMLKFGRSPWTAESGAEVRGTMRDMMHLEVAKPWDMWCTLLKTVNARRRLSCKQFSKALRDSLHFDGSEHVLDNVFYEMDADQCGEVCYDEFLSWLSFRPQRRQLARKLTLSRHRPAEAPALWEIDWTPEVLRRELQYMLVRADLSALDVLSAHDKSEDGDLSKREFLSMMKFLVGNAYAWAETNVKEVASVVFGTIAGNDELVQIEELERWLLKGWKEALLEAPKGLTHIDAKADVDDLEADKEGVGTPLADEDVLADGMAVGDRLYMLNPRFSDGTRLRTGPSPDASFSGDYLLNDAEVEVLEITPCGFVRIRGRDSRNSVEGWVRASNLSTHNRRVGLPITLSPMETSPSEGRRIDRVKSGIDMSVIQCTPEPDATPATLKSASKPELGSNHTPKNARELQRTAARLKESADLAEEAARRTELLLRKRNVAAEYARSAAFAAAAEQTRVLSTHHGFRHGEATRKRMIQERERMELIRGIETPASRPQGQTQRPQSRAKSPPTLGRQSEQNLGQTLVQVGVPGGNARPYW